MSIIEGYSKTKYALCYYKTKYALRPCSARKRVEKGQLAWAFSQPSCPWSREDQNYYPKSTQKLYKLYIRITTWNLPKIINIYLLKLWLEFKNFVHFLLVITTLEWIANPTLVHLSWPVKRAKNLSKTKSALRPDETRMIVGKSWHS